jgi:hypothetical protein
MGLVGEYYGKELYEELEKLEPVFYHASFNSPEKTREYIDKQFEIITNVLKRHGIDFIPDFYSMNRDRKKEKRITLSKKKFKKLSEKQSIRSDDFIEIRIAGYKVESSDEEDPEDKFRTIITKPEEPHYEGDVF